MPCYDYKGHSLAYELFGSGPVAILFIHGLGGSGRWWKYQIDHFQSRYTILAVDLFGHGRSTKDVEPAFVARLDAEAIDALMRDVVRKKAIVVGHSYSSQILPEIIKLGYPDLAGIVFIDCTYQGYEEIILGRVEFANKMLTLDNSHLTVETKRWQRALIGEKVSDEDLELIFSTLPDCDYRWLFESVASCREYNRKYPPEETPIWAELPIFIMESDNGVGADLRKSWMNHFKKARYVLFENSWHFFFMTEHEKFNRQLEEFLTGIS